VSNTLLHLGADSTTTEVYSNTTRKANRLTQTATIPQREGGNYCSVEEIQPGVHHVTSTARQGLPPPSAESFLDILREWGCTWMWEHLSLEGGSYWLPAAIQDNSLVAVADGLYIRQMYPDLCAAAFVLECKKGRGKIIRSFSEESIAANAYRGELLGILAVHLILVSVNRLNSFLAGSVEVVFNCLGALSRVVNLPPYCIPSRCKHSDILKNILVNCRDLSFSVHFSHIKAHQNDRSSFDKLSRKAQLNCICNHLAKQQVGEAGQSKHSGDSLFPLEHIGILIGGKKLSSEPGPQLRFHAHRQLAKALFLQKKILSERGFDEVGWAKVHSTLHSVSRLFQLWASKHVLGIAGMMKFLSHQDGHDRSCPSCLVSEETCRHVAVCQDAGRTAAFEQSMACVTS
jgi:hypothetical protein